MARVFQRKLLLILRWVKAGGLFANIPNKTLFATVMLSYKVHVIEFQKRGLVSAASVPHSTPHQRRTVSVPYQPVIAVVLQLLLTVTDYC